MKKAGMTVTLVVGIFMIVAVSALFYNFLEWEKPKIKIAETFDMLGSKRTVTIKISDARSGIRSVEVALVQKEHTFDITRLDVPAEGENEKTLAVEVSPRKLKMKDGPAVFQVTAVDYSPLRNTTVLQRKVTIDTVPLHVSLLTRAHNINPGGSCLAAYTLSKPVVRSGVVCGNAFFPGYPETTDKGKTYYVCYFAIPMDVSRSTVMNVAAYDRAGNQSIVSIPFYIRSAQRFYADKLSIGADFITRKAAEFQQEHPDLEGKPVEQAFTYINSQMRKENEKAIQAACLKTSAKQLWQGEFLMMKNGATKARFGDRRTYELNGAPIGESLHQGVDLASLEHAPVEASNSGTISFAGNLGIYGNAVIIDHGQGISTLYGHMSALQVTEGQQVQKGQTIGVTGMSGWAGGDHLHVSTLVGGVFVNPIEWWDPHWIKDNVQLKLEDVRASF